MFCLAQLHAKSIVMHFTCVNEKKIQVFQTDASNSSMNKSLTYAKLFKFFLCPMNILVLAQSLFFLCYVFFSLTSIQVLAFSTSAPSAVCSCYGAAIIFDIDYWSILKTYLKLNFGSCSFTLTWQLLSSYIFTLPVVCCHMSCPSLGYSDMIVFYEFSFLSGHVNGLL